MSKIDYVTFSITRTSMHEGSICSINYAYHLNVDKEAYLENKTYEIQCELCGEHPGYEEELGEHMYDKHQVSNHTPMPVKRTFLVPCEVLDERIGKDAIHIRLFVRGDANETFTFRSETVKDWF